MDIQADKIALAKMLLETEKTHDFLEELSFEQIKEIEKLL